MASSYVFNHVEQALGRLVHQLSDKPNMAKLITIFAEEVQEIEDGLWACIVERYLDTASGKQLDDYGVLVDQARLGFTDEDYRALLKVVIVANRSNGEIDRLNYILSACLADPPDPGPDVRFMFPYTEGGQYSMQYLVSNESSLVRREIAKKQLKRATPAGVGIETVVEHVIPLGAYFGFSDDPLAGGFGSGTFADDWWNDA